MQHEVGPVELGFDMAGGEVGAQVGPPDVPGGNEAQAFFRESQRGFHERLVAVLWNKPQDVVPGKVMVAIEHRLEREAALEIGATENECERLTGRHEIAIGIPNATELRELAIEGLVLGVENIQQLRTDVGDQAEDERHALGEGESIMPDQPGVTGFGLAKVGRVDFEDVLVLGLLAEVELESEIEQTGEPREFLFEVARVLLDDRSHGFHRYHSTWMGACIQGSLTQLMVQGNRSRTTS